ncbi:hypothetical protein BGZ98_005814 [Dissophora globulifera]|nr:hypothetical protein BGZ98_005814 [Dissophora globulifera]
MRYAIVQRLVVESPEPLTVILACRNKGRAQEALDSLWTFFNALEHKRKQQETAYHKPELRIELVDVGSVTSVLAFNQRIRDQYRHVDYLFCNAGILPSTGVLWGKVLTDMFVAPMDLVSRSDALAQPKQHLTEDGIGNVIACNVFGHYLMIRGLEDQLSKTEQDPGRVIWTGSMTAEKNRFSINDWQGLEAEQPYESSKWVTDLLAIRLNEIWAGVDLASGVSSGYLDASSLDATSNANLETVSLTPSPTRRNTRSAAKAVQTTTTASSNSVSPKRHIVSITTHPGVVASGIGGLSAFIVMMRIVLHYVLRLAGERNQTITGYHGALSNVHAALKQPVEKLDYKFKYGVRCRRLGQEILRVDKLVEYDEDQAKIVVSELEKLRLSFTSS